MFSMKCCRRVLLLNYPNIATAMKALQIATRIATAMQQQTAVIPGAYSKWPLQNKIILLMLHIGVLDRMLSVKA